MAHMEHVFLFLWNETNVTTSFGFSRKLMRSDRLSSSEIHSREFFFYFVFYEIWSIRLSSFIRLYFLWFGYTFRLYCFHPDSGLSSFIVGMLSYCLFSSYSIDTIDLILTVANWLLKSIVIVLSSSPFDQANIYG